MDRKLSNIPPAWAALLAGRLLFISTACRLLLILCLLYKNAPIRALFLTAILFFDMLSM